MKLSIYEKRQLEKLLHEAVLRRDKGVCRRCGGQNRLQASHIYPKGRYQKMRYELDNLLTLCYACHINWWHKNPIEVHEWYKQNVDSSIQARLKLRSHYTDKTPLDYKLIKIYLENKIKEFAFNIKK